MIPLKGGEGRPQILRRAALDSDVGHIAVEAPAGGRAHGPTGGASGRCARLAVGAAVVFILAPGAARADTGEISLRPSLLAERRAARAEGQTVVGYPLGGGLRLGFGLTPELSLTAGYAYSRTGQLSVLGADPRTREVFALTRHALGLGLAFAWSDQHTPILLVEGGGVREAQVSPQWHLSTLAGERLIPPFLHDRAAWRPSVRATALYEWRFREQLSVSGGLGAGYEGGPVYQVVLGAAAYRYWP